MKILFTSSEATPLIKTGGLADVAGSLPVALRSQGLDCRVIIPAYPEAVAKGDDLEIVAELELPGSTERVRLLSGTAGPHAVPVYLLDAPLL
ncbi:MAG: glycogen/starch synthase, partial [Pseudomonadota bacterium]